MSMNRLTILNDLPKFSGNARATDKNFRPGINVKNFFRTIENHFAANNINDDAKKVQILFALISKEQGDALDLINCFAGKTDNFETIKATFLSCYPNFSTSEFTHAVQTVIQHKLENPSLFCGLTKLETITRALVESYLDSSNMKKTGLGLETKIPVKKKKEKKEGEGEDSDDSDSGDEEQTEIELTNVLQNLLMHMVLSTQLHKKVYKKVSGIMPGTSSTTFMATAVKAAERQKLLDKDEQNKKGRGSTKTPEVIFKVENNEYRKPQAGLENNGKGKSIPTCFRCNKRGHMAKECRSSVPEQGTDNCSRCGKKGHSHHECYLKNTKCSFCKRTGHLQKVCRKRLALGKFCSNCKVSNSHDTTECFKGDQRVNVVEENVNRQETNWPPTASTSWASEEDEDSEPSDSDQ